MNADLENVAADLKRGLWRLTAATATLWLVVIAAIVLVWLDGRARRADLARTTLQTNQALCTLRQDLVVRVQASVDFLLKHPHGIPGVPVATIRAGIDNQQRTIDALAGLACPPSREGAHP